ncbi:MAG: hypothetical protein GPI95_13515 [Microcystis aeruginosa LG13-11]|nr:hypothetical protein [Microcystis aeruginosa LG13-11]
MGRWGVGGGVWGVGCDGAGGVMGCGVWGVGRWGSGVVGHLAEISLNPYIPKSLYPYIPFLTDN